MSNQTDRLEALLARVQQNRQQPRAVAGFASTIAGHAAPGPAAAPPERRAEPRAPEPRAPEPRAKPAATPLEMAFENSVNVSANAAPARAPNAAPSVNTAPARAPNAGAGPRGATQPLHSQPAAAPREGVMLVDPSPMQPGRPIAQVVSKHPPSQAATFGELLRRSLSLRPR
jgi:hypothetical protein